MFVCFRFVLFDFVCCLVAGLLSCFFVMLFFACFVRVFRYGLLRFTCCVFLLCRCLYIYVLVQFLRCRLLFVCLSVSVCLRSLFVCFVQLIYIYRYMASCGFLREWIRKCYCWSACVFCLSMACFVSWLFFDVVCVCVLPFLLFLCYLVFFVFVCCLFACLCLCFFL